MAVEEAIRDATLNEDALAELGLSEQPFVDNKKFSRFSDSTSQTVRAELEQHLRFGESLHLFIGDKGAGKTVFLSQLIKHCKDSIKPFVAKGADNFETIAFLAAVLNQLGGEATETISDHVDALIPLFEDLADNQMSVVLAIDDAHLAPIEEFAELIDIMPSFIKENGDITARLLLTGEPRLKTELTAVADEFEEDFSFDHSTTTLAAMDESRVREYLTSQLNQAGHTDAFPFTDKAVAKIHRESNGLPANINGLAGKYLNTVYSGTAAKAGGKGFFAALGWPLLALGTAAIGLIAWGLSMFFGNDQSSPVVTIDPAVVTAPETTVATNAVNNELQQSIQSAENTVTQAATDTASAATQGTTAQNNAVIIEPDTNPLADTTTSAAVNTGDDLLKPADRMLQPDDSQTAVAGTSEVRQQAAEQTAIVSSEPTIVATEPVVVSTEPLTEPTETVIQVTPATTVTEAVNETVQQFSENLSSTAQGIGSTAGPTAGDQQLPVPNSVAVTVPNTDSTNTNSIDDDAASVTSATDNGIPVTVAPINNIGSNTAETASGQSSVAIENPVTNNPLVDNAQGNNPDSVQVAVPSSADAAINRAIENERWVLFQAPTKFTVQLATSRERNYIINLAQSLEAEDPVAIYPFKTTNSQNPVFGLLSGLYDTRSDAIEAVDQMPENTKQFGVWIRPIADLQTAIRNQQ